MSSGTQFTFIMLSASAHKSSKNPFGKNGLFNGASPMMLFQLAKDLCRNMTDAEKQL